MNSLSCLHFLRQLHLSVILSCQLWDIIFTGGGGGEWGRGRAAPHLWRGGLDFHSSSKVGSSKFCPAVREILLLFNNILPRVASENHKYALYLFFFVQLQPKVHRDILFSNKIIVDDNALHVYILLR